MFVQQWKKKKMFLEQRSRDIVGKLSASHCSHLEGATAVLWSPVGPRLDCFRDPPSSLKTEFFKNLFLILSVLNSQNHGIRWVGSRLRDLVSAHFPKFWHTISLLITGQPGFVPFSLPSSFKALSSSCSSSRARAPFPLWDRCIPSGVRGPRLE